MTLADTSWTDAHTTEIQMRFGDVDSLGHVNNVAYAQYLETARIAFLRDLGLSLPTVIARLEVDYRREVKLGQRVRVQLKCTRTGRSSFDFSYRVLSDDDTLAAEARSVQVHVDPDTRRPRPLSDAQRAALEGGER